MKIKVTRRLRPKGKQHRYVVTCDPSPILSATRANKTRGDSLPEAMALCPAWAFPIIDRALLHIRDARPWSVADDTVSLTIEIK
jgi:hypothetical protein